MNIRHLLTIDHLLLETFTLERLTHFLSNNALHLGKKVGMLIIEKFVSRGAAAVHVVIVKTLVLCDEHNVLL